jgi:hypothetical protein
MKSVRPFVPVRMALAALIVASAIAASTLRRALEPEPSVAVVAGSLAMPATPVPVPGTGTAAGRVLAAVNKDPFHAERRRPAVRFRLPGEAVSPDTLTAAAGAGNLFQLIGTAVLPEGRGFAMCQWGTESPKLVRVGERVGDLTLKVVARGRATFVDATGRTREVRVPKAGT